MNDSITLRIADELSVSTGQVDAAVKLLDEGATVPFIARYRKEVTGALDDTQLRRLAERLQRKSTDQARPNPAKPFQSASQLSNSSRGMGELR